MFKPILLSAALTCLVSLTAQARTYYEYWFDNDIDNRRTAESTVGETRLTLTVGDMPEGAHVLFMRASVDDEWSATSSRLFVKPYAQSVAPIELFEKLLKVKPSLVEMFCPSAKCVSLVRVSKTGQHYGYRDTPVEI